MGASISPVLQAFLQGQQQQTRVIGQAKDIQNAAEARKERQAQLDEVIRQHGVEAKIAQSRLELEQQSHALEHQKAWMDVIDNFKKGQQNESIPLQTMGTSLNIPGYSSPQQSTPTPQGDAPPSGVPIPGVNLQQIPAVNPIQQVVNPFDPAGMSQTAPPAITSGGIAARAEAIANDRYQQTVATTNAANRDAKADQADKDRATRQQIADNHLQEVQSRNDMLGMIGLLNANHKKDAEDAKDLVRHGGLAPDEFAQQIESNAHDIGLGQKHLKDITLPEERTQTNRRLQELGLVDTPPKAVDTLLNAASTAASYLSGINNVKSLVKDTNPAANTVRGLLPDAMTGLSPLKSDFEATVKPLITQLEAAQGISLARGGSSPAFFKLQAGMQPRINDNPSTMDYKGTSGAHLLLSEAARSISNLPAAQQKLLWKVVTDKYPTLLDNPTIAQKLVGKGGATNTGLYDSTNPKVEDFK